MSVSRSISASITRHAQAAFRKSLYELGIVPLKCIWRQARQPLDFVRLEQYAVAPGAASNGARREIVRRVRRNPGGFLRVSRPLCSLQEIARNGGPARFYEGGAPWSRAVQKYGRDFMESRGLNMQRRLHRH